VNDIQGNANSTASRKKTVTAELYLVGRVIGGCHKLRLFILFDNTNIRYCIRGFVPAVFLLTCHTIFSHNNSTMMGFQMRLTLDLCIPMYVHL
jgi:hypothetical protein